MILAARMGLGGPVPFRELLRGLETALRALAAVRDL
jgi:hypothetical protein